MRGIVLSIALCLFLASLPKAAAQIDPTDLPPPPSALPAATELQSAWYLRDAARAAELHAASTNAAVQQALGKIRDLAAKVESQQKAAWEKDPLLLTCDRFIGKTHDWVMKYHGAELAAEMKFFFSTNDQATVESRRRMESDLTRMMDFVLFKELGDNTNFAPLQKSLYGILEEVFKQNTNNTARPDLFRYWWFDRFIGYPDTNRPVADGSFTNLQVQVGKRYEFILAGIAKFQQQKNLPSEVVAGLKYGHLYRTLDGMCEAYLETRTPPELQKLREDLRHQIIDLSWLEKNKTP